MRLGIPQTEWAKLSAWVGEQIEDRQARLETPLEPIATATIRGEIRMLRSILLLEKPKPDDAPMMTPNY